MLDLNCLQSSVMTHLICFVLNLFAFLLILEIVGRNYYLELVFILADQIQFFVYRVRRSMQQGNVLFRFVVVALIDFYFRNSTLKIKERSLLTIALKRYFSESISCIIEIPAETKKNTR